MQSCGNLSDELSEFVNYYIQSLSDKEYSSESILVNTESVVENLTNDIINPCKTLPACDVVGQETSRSSIVQIVDLKSPSLCRAGHRLGRRRPQRPEPPSALSRYRAEVEDEGWSVCK
jgi:hypothetical protein